MHDEKLTKKQLKKNPQAVNSLAPSTMILNKMDGGRKGAESPTEEMEMASKPNYGVQMQILPSNI